jgi:hypothetical protein
MGMYHSTSGKIGYDYHARVPPRGARIIPKGVMKQIMQREDELRFSEEVCPLPLIPSG